jgi:hypothetical protein
VALQDPNETLLAKLNLENAPDGFWRGKLVTGETTGAAALADREPTDQDRS